MAVKQFGKEWTKQNFFKSLAFFFVHFLLLIIIIASLLLTKNWGVHSRDDAANYLYALFCILLLTVIMYLYFLFENKTMLATGKNITLLFIVLDLYFIMSFFIGQQRIFKSRFEFQKTFNFRLGRSCNCQRYSFAFSGFFPGRC